MQRTATWMSPLRNCYDGTTSLDTWASGRFKFLMSTGVLSTSQAQRALHRRCCAMRSYPKCASCQYAKQTLRPAPGNLKTTVKDRAGILKADHVHPGGLRVSGSLCDLCQGPAVLIKRENQLQQPVLRSVSVHRPRLWLHSRGSPSSSEHP